MPNLHTSKGITAEDLFKDKEYRIYDNFGDQKLIDRDMFIVLYDGSIINGRAKWSKSSDNVIFENGLLKIPGGSSNEYVSTSRCLQYGKFYVKFKSLSDTEGCICFQYKRSGNNPRHFIYLDDTSLMYRATNSDGTINKTVTTTVTVDYSDDVEILVAEDNAGNVKVYLNGNQEISTTAGNDFTPTNIRISSEYKEGFYLKEVKVWKVEGWE